MNLTIVPYDKVDDNKWDDFVNNSKYGHAYFLKDVISHYWYKDWENRSFAVINTDSDEIVFIMQLNAGSRKKHWWKKIQYNFKSQWGFCINRNLPRKTKQKLCELLSNYFDSLFITGGASNLWIDGMPPLCDDLSPEAKQLVNPVMDFNFSPTVRYTYVVDLSKSDERLLADCEETTRQAIRKLSANGKYEIVESDGSDEDLDKYIKLHKETFVRTDHKKNILYDEYHQNMFKKLLPQGICKVFFLKDKVSGEYVASNAILTYKNTAYYWWGASRNDKEIGVNKYLLFETIKKIKQQFQNTGFFETGGGYPYLRAGKNKGLNDFKKSFGTFLHPIYGDVYVRK